MTDLFDNTIICSKCNAKMKPVEIERKGFMLRAVQCPKCSERIIHPKDDSEYSQFQHLRNKTFRVKMRIVGNSYAVSIPKEIVDFIKDQERIMDDFVRVAFDDARKLSLMFGDGKVNKGENTNEEE
jgi:DNA-directed RNA polymerase subunit RPC12/RpoP